MPLNDCDLAAGFEVIDETLVVSSVTISAVLLTSGDVEIPALQATWTDPAIPYVSGIQFEYQETGLGAGAVRTDAQGIGLLSWSTTDGIAPNKSYQIRYRAVGEGKYGEWSTPVSRTTGAAVPPPSPIASGTVLYDETVAGAWSFPKPGAGSTTYLIIEIWGGGGGGANATNSSKTVYPGWGGGGAGYCKHKILLSSAPATLSGSIGAPGGVAAAGGNTTCSSPSLAANGGGAATPNNPGTSTGGSAGAGGTASGGSEANTTGRNGGLTNVWDGGGSAPANTDQTTNGNPGVPPGGGGAGGYYAGGAAGANGRVKITASDT